MTINKFGTAVWRGTIKEGKGFITSESKALTEQPYGFNTRFEGKAGTNPEELIGSAHAACFSMALSKIIGDADLEPKQIDTKATVSLEKSGDGFKVSSVHLDVQLQVPNAKDEELKSMANKAKEGCPISKLLNAKITMDVVLNH